MLYIFYYLNPYNNNMKWITRHSLKVTVTKIMPCLYSQVKNSWIVGRSKAVRKGTLLCSSQVHVLKIIYCEFISCIHSLGGWKKLFFLTFECGLLMSSYIKNHEYKSYPDVIIPELALLHVLPCIFQFSDIIRSCILS